VGGALPSISQDEYRMRREAVAAGMEAAGLDALAIFYPARVAYLTGFHHIPTERPIGLVIGSTGSASLVVPAVEKEHAESAAEVDQVRVYFEYPGAEHPMSMVAEVLAEMNARPQRTGADHDGYVPFWGYRGPRLSDLIGAEPVDAELIVEALRRVKSETELACIQLACDWAVRGHRRMQAAIEVGKTEIECYTPPATETLLEMVREMPGWRPRGADDTGFIAMFVAGRTTAMPHGFVKGHGIQPGDVLVTGAAANIDGYRSELERTLIVGEPTPEQERAFAAKPPPRWSWRRSVSPSSWAWPATCATTPATRSGWRDMRLPSSTAAMTRCSSPAWSSPWSRVSTSARSGASATRTRS
jgi:Xaa-Pro dipeptidase